MPISSGAGGRRIGRDSSRPSASMSAARSTPNLALGPAGQPGQAHPGSRMIDAPPRVETRRQLGSQTLYGSRPPWATDDDSPSPKKEQQTPPPQQPQPPFYPAGGELLHGEAARMRRLKAARELYKSPHSRRKHNTGSVDDLLRDCAVSDHSHSPSPVRRAPSNASSLAHSSPNVQAQQERRNRSTSRPATTTRSTGVGTADGTTGSSPPLRRRRNDGSIVSDDSLDDGDDRKKRAAADSGANRRSRQRQSRTTRGTSPPPPQKPLFVDTGCDASDWVGEGNSPPARQSFARSKMPTGLKPAAERKYVPPPPVRQPSPSVKRHACLPADNPPFRARPMPDFRRVSPSPGRNRSRSQSPAPQAALAPTSSATTSGYRSGGGSSPPRRHDHQPRRRRSMDEDSLTEASSATEVLQPRRAPGDSRAAAADAVDSALRSLEPAPVNRQPIGGSGSGRSSLLLVPDKVLRDRSVMDIDLDEIFGTSGQPQQQTRPPPAPRQAPQAYAAQTADVGDNGVEVNERIQYWLKRNIYFHTCEPAPNSQQQPQQQQQQTLRSKYAASPPSSDTLRSMSEHRPQQPRMEILVQRTDVHQLPPATGDGPLRHVSTVEYPVRKFQQLPYGYLSPSSSEGDGSADEEDAGGRQRVPGAEILRQAVVYARSTGTDSGFWFSAENGGAPRSLGTAYNAAPAQTLQQPRPASAASSSGSSSRGGGRVRALASRFNQQPTGPGGEYMSSYQQPITPARNQPISNGHAAVRQSTAPAVSAQLRRVVPSPAPATPPAPSTAADSKTFYFGDSSLVSKREQREHWASDYFNRPKIEIIDRSGAQ